MRNETPALEKLPGRCIAVRTQLMCTNELYIGPLLSSEANGSRYYQLDVRMRLYCTNWRTCRSDTIWRRSFHILTEHSSWMTQISNPSSILPTSNRKCFQLVSGYDMMKLQLPYKATEEDQEKKNTGSNCELALIEEQRTAVKTFLCGQLVLTLLPTGFGKT